MSIEGRIQHLNYDKNYTYEKIAIELKISTAQVQEIERKALNKLLYSHGRFLKDAKKKEQYKTKKAALKDKLKVAQTKVKDIEKQLKALDKEFGVKKPVSKPNPNVLIIGNSHAASQRAKAKRLKVKLDKAIADKADAKTIAALKKQYKEMDRKSRMK